MASEYADGTAPWELAFYAQAEVLSLEEALRRMRSTERCHCPGRRSRENMACSRVKWREQQGGSVLPFGVSILLRKGETR